MIKTTAMRNLKMKTAGAMALLLAAGFAHATKQGPDAYGYQATDQTPYSFVDITAGGGVSILSGIDDGAAALTLPFGFNFYGTSYTNVCVSANGAIYFVADPNTCTLFNNGSLSDYANTDLSATPAPGDLPGIFPFWTDLDFSAPGAGAVYYQTIGSAGSRRFIVQWQAAYPQGDSVTVTFQAILAEGANTITFQYSNVTLGASDVNNNGHAATVAIRNAAGQTSGQALQWSYDSPVLANNLSILFQAPTAQTISFAPLSNQPFGTAPFTVTATASSGLAVSFASTTTGVCTISGSTVTLVAIGTCSITASQAGNANFAVAASVSQSFTVTQAAQTISFSALSNATLGAAPFTVSATASSGLGVSFASTTTSVCTVSGSTVTLVAVGTCSISASQAGNANYGAATPVTQSFTVSATSQTITFGVLSNVTFGAAPFGISATASSGLTVSFASTTAPVCTVSGSTVTVVAAGTCSITASQAGNANFGAAPNVTQSFTVSQASQTITFGTISGVTVGAAPFGLTATASSGLAVSFASTTTSVCTVSGSTVTIVTAGTCSITASQAGNGSFAAAANVSQSFTVTPAPTTVTLSLVNHNGVSGDNVQLAMQIATTGASTPAGFQADLSFDSTKLTFVSASAGVQSTNAGKSLSTSTLPNGNVRLLATGFNQNSIANGIVASATFTMNSAFTSGTTVVTPLNCSSTDANGNALATPCTAGTIKAVTCNIKGSGTTNVVDVQLIINEALGVAPAVHDLNGGGVVNVADVQIVINAALGLGCNVP